MIKIILRSIFIIVAQVIQIPSDIISWLVIIILTKKFVKEGGYESLKEYRDGLLKIAVLIMRRKLDWIKTGTIKDDLYDYSKDWA